MEADLLARLEAQSDTIARLLQISGAPGLSLGVFHKGRVVHTVHMGKRDVEKAEVPDDESIYHVASTFKIVTACTVARLVTDGVLDWNLPIRNYLPGVRRNDDFGTQATIRDLLSNRTGLPMASFYWGQQNGEQLIGKEHFVAIVNSLQAVKKLRTSFLYSQWNYCLLQLIVENVTGKSFDAVVREVIFNPLGLQSPTFELPTGGNVVKPYAVRKDGSVSLIKTCTFTSSSGLAAGVGGKCRLQDQLALYMALLRAYRHQVENDVDETPDSPFTHLRTIFTPHVKLPGSTLNQQAYCLGVYRSELPANLSCASLNGALSSGMIPLAGDDQPSIRGEEVFHHTANSPGYVGSMFLLPRTQSGIVVLSNATPLMDAPDLIAQTLLSVLLDINPPKDVLKIAEASSKVQSGWYKQLDTILKGFKTDTPPTQPLTAYEGTYWNSLGNFKIKIKALEGKLRVSINESVETFYDVGPYDGDTFYWEADRDREIVDNGMWFNPIPQVHLIHFEVDKRGVKGLQWQHDRQMTADTFSKEGVMEDRSRL